MSAWKPVNLLVIPVLLTLRGIKYNFSSSLFAFQWSSESITKGGNEGSNETPFLTSGSLHSLTYEPFLANLKIQPDQNKLLGHTTIIRELAGTIALTFHVTQVFQDFAQRFHQDAQTRVG